MRNALPRFLHCRRRCFTAPSPRNGRDSSENPPLKCFLVRCQAVVEIRSCQKIDHIRLSDHLLRRRFSTGFTSVHGGRPSAEYAKLRKESLESEFGNILGTYGSKTWFAYRRFGPFLALYRAAIISFQVAKLTVWHFLLQDINKRAVKLGQALSTRPDILPTAYCQELSKLQDQIPPFSTHVAIKSIESQLGAPIYQIFSDISPKPIAAASLGQVYKVMQLIYILGSL